MLYLLIITDVELSYANYSEDFSIGVFQTKEKAIETARYYFENVKGFCDYPCTYRIEKKDIIDNCDAITPDNVWIVQGWNTNDYLDEIDIVESPFILSEKRANSELQIMKKNYKRKEWCISNWKIGKLEWQEGFVRNYGHS